ncbi:hypothetical protein [Siccibacter turicensis]|uniref:hypothetical protein n=1 Tax=Siccibacter turicensis TaxID=357233 RepID=UPI003F559F2D
MTHETLDARYQHTSHQTQALWRAQHGVGDVMTQDYYDTGTLAPVTGIQPRPGPAIERLLADINALAGDDPLADAMPANGLHFTFLPVMLPRYRPSEQPEHLALLTRLWREYCAGHPLTLSRLRLVALPSQLLLAGIPDAHSLRQRAAFAQALLETPFRDDLLARHATTPLPAPFWHSTLLRYRAQRLPARFQRYFADHQQQDYGSVSAPVTLVMANYNWTQVQEIAS